MERITRAAAALGIRVPRVSARRIRYILTVVLAATLLPSGTALAAGTLTSASVALSDPTPSATAGYTFTGSSVDTSTAILCVKVVWSTTASGDTAPTGFSGASGSVDAANSSFVNNTSTNWSLARSDGTGSTGQNNIYKYTNSSSGFTPSSSPRTFVLSGIANPSSAGTYYFQISTYGNTNCASSPIDNATVTFANTSGTQLSLSVDESLSFTVNSMGASSSCDATTTTKASTATTLPFGTVTTGSNGVVCQDLQAATNAAHGFTVYLRYTAKPTSGADTIADLGGGSPVPNSSPTAFTAAGTEGYGYSTDDATLGTGTADRFTNYDSAGHQGWAAASTTNAEIGYVSGPAGTTDFHIGHQIGIAATTNPGLYNTTIIYTCTPVY